MKFEGSLFIGCAIFFGGTDIVYWYFSKDPTGTTALALAVGLAAAIAAMGVAIGWWMFLIGLLALFLTTIGFVFEYYRGVYAH